MTQRDARGRFLSAGERGRFVKAEPDQHAPTREDIEFGFNYAKQMAAAQSMMNAVAANPSLASLDPTGAQAFQNLYQGLKHRKPWYRRLNDWLRGGK